MVSKGVVGMAVQVVRTHGVLALYNGLTASLGRQVSDADESHNFHGVLSC